MPTQDGDIDYSRYSVAELREALSGIRRDAYPRNHANIVAALAALNEPVRPAPKQPTAADGADSDLASRGLRLSAVSIDAVIGFAIMFPIMFFQGYWQLAMAAANNNEQLPYAMVLQWQAIALLVFVLVQGYPLIRDGQTWGKKAVSIRIVDLLGRKPSISKLSIRYAIIMVATSIPFVGRLIALVDVCLIFRDDKRCGHDLAAGTRVVRVVPSTSTPIQAP